MTDQPTRIKNDEFVDYTAPFKHMPLPELQSSSLLTDGVIRLTIMSPDELSPAYEVHPVWKHATVPSYAFSIVNAVNEAEVFGRLHLRIGHSQFTFIGGHIGYGVDELYRGHRYATRAAKLAVEFARKVHGLETLFVTCGPENVASSKTIGGIEGGVYLGVFDIEKDTPMYAAGDRQVCVFRFGSTNMPYAEERERERLSHDTTPPYKTSFLSE
ncbi:hypothetical protein BC830DRAFT_1134799 [Chytriomyces sp. MP71]|nr:hypothetical protein BC830DRAFT_1134799 [Chytriomyces sp. MP71]